VTVQDIFDFLTAYFSSAAPADINGVGGVTVQDIFDYLTLYFAGCP
jgi:predicted Zn-dependent peptidase